MGRGERAEVLPVDRGQNCALRRQGEPSNFPRARRSNRARGVRARLQHGLTRNLATRALAHTSWVGELQNPETCVRCRVRLFARLPVQTDARDEKDFRFVFLRSNQRYDGLRRSRGTRSSRGHQRRAVGEGWCEQRRERTHPSSRRFVPRHPRRRLVHKGFTRTLPHVDLKKRVQVGVTFR